MSSSDLTRRHALTAAAAVTAATSLTSTGLLTTPAAAAPAPLRNDELKEALRRVEARRRRLDTSRPSANGWEMQKATDDGGDIVARPVPGCAEFYVVDAPGLGDTPPDFVDGPDDLSNDGQRLPSWASPFSLLRSASPHG
ncbi:hypothetical protein AB0P17_33855 [Streptomyces sp. NPDC088124]|uniref:hypothetical protein n=1 Tax=Streptomyces sp. NPDC088124 TaxID=3154654 RepID=UPI003425FC8F